MADNLRIDGERLWSSLMVFDETAATEMYIACSPAKEGMQEIVEQLNEGLIELRANDKLKPLLTKYGLKDWKR